MRGAVSHEDSQFLYFGKNAMIFLDNLTYGQTRLTCFRFLDIGANVPAVSGCNGGTDQTMADTTAELGASNAPMIITFNVPTASPAGNASQDT